jgi:hypothetical protein
MKLMKVMYISKNMMNKESQHFVDFQLTEVRKMKMQMIQLVSILNLIQMKLMNVSENFASHVAPTIVSSRGQIVTIVGRGNSHCSSVKPPKTFPPLSKMSVCMFAYPSHRQ